MGTEAEATVVTADIGTMIMQIADASRHAVVTRAPPRDGRTMTIVGRTHMPAGVLHPHQRRLDGAM